MTSTRINSVFYLVVLGVALTGAGQAATGWLGWWPPFAFAAVAAVELGGVALSVHADERRRLGERAIPARLLSTLVAAGAVLTNFFGHLAFPGQAWFFAGMSALGYTVWTIQSAARRRDQLRAAGKLPPTPPVYGLRCWLTHPGTTARARHLALADPTLGAVGSLTAARTEHHRDRQRTAISTVLQRKLRAAVDPATAELAVAVYDLDLIAERLRAGADYPGLAALVAADLAPANLAPATPPPAPEPSAAGKSVTAPDATASATSDKKPETGSAAHEQGTTTTPTTAARIPTPLKTRATAPDAPPKRTFAMTRQAATSLEASGMAVPQIAITLGITERQVRKALHPAPPTEAKAE